MKAQFRIHAVGPHRDCHEERIRTAGSARAALRQVASAHAWPGFTAWRGDFGQWHASAPDAPLYFATATPVPRCKP